MGHEVNSDSVVFTSVNTPLQYFLAKVCLKDCEGIQDNGDHAFGLLEPSQCVPCLRHPLKIHSDAPCTSVPQVRNLDVWVQEPISRILAFEKWPDSPACWKSSDSQVFSPRQALISVNW